MKREGGGENVKATAETLRADISTVSHREPLRHIQKVMFTPRQTILKVNETPETENTLALEQRSFSLQV